MERTLFYISIVLFGTIYLSSCKKEDPPVDPACDVDHKTSLIDDSTVQVDVYAYSPSAHNIVEIGFEGNLSDSKQGLNVSGGTYSFTVNDLTLGGLYAINGYAILEDGTKFKGVQKTFTIPYWDTVSVAATVSNITFKSADISVEYALTNSVSTVTEVGVYINGLPTPSNTGINQIIGISNFSFDTLQEGVTYSYTPYIIVNNIYWFGDTSYFSTTDIPNGPAGGYVFYDDGNGGGLEMAPEYILIQWGCDGTDVQGTSSTLGSGQNNTNLIIAYCPFTSTAALTCSNFSFGGYDDWYLPSLDELIEIYSLHTLYPGLIPDYDFWSSTQYDPTGAYSILFGYPLNPIPTGKSNLYEYAIPVRSF